MWIFDCVYRKAGKEDLYVISLFKDNSHTGTIAGFGDNDEEAIINGQENLRKKKDQFDTKFHTYYITESARKFAEKHIGERFTNVDELYYCHHSDTVILKEKMDEYCPQCTATLCGHPPIKECVITALTNEELEKAIKKTEELNQQNK